MQISEVLRRLQSDRDELLHELHDLDAEMHRLQQQLDLTETRISTLEETAEMLGLDVHDDADDVRTPAQGLCLKEVSWPRLDRTSAIEQVLHESGKSMSPSEVVEVLSSHGRDDGYDVVTSTLSYLKKSRRVFQPERGKYRLLPQRTTAEKVAEFAATAAAAMAVTAAVGIATGALSKGT